MNLRNERIIADLGDFPVDDKESEIENLPSVNNEQVIDPAQGVMNFTTEDLMAEFGG